MHEDEPLISTPPVSPHPFSPHEPSSLTKLVAKTLTNLEKGVSREPFPIPQHEAEVETKGQVSTGDGRKRLAPRKRARLQKSALLVTLDYLP
ncbi:testis-expressed protein 36 isoform X3 [Sesbania bispinosa]|nr:testis-expressed protein 36 isoform X3 [Sesbania bispinosa]